MRSNNYEIILKDISPKEGAKDVAISSSLWNGYACWSVKGCAIEKDFEEFKECLIKHAESINNNLNDPKKEETALGPLISRRLVEKCEYHVRDAIKNGGRVIVGWDGKKSSHPNVFPYTIMENVNERCKLVWEETPGPVLWIHEDFERVLQWIQLNETKYPINNQFAEIGVRVVICTNEVERLKKIASKLRTGTISQRGIDLDPLYAMGCYGQILNFVWAILHC